MAIEEENIEEEFNLICEVRGRDENWRVSYPDEGDIQTPFPVYDKEGKLKTVIYAGGSSGKLTELNIVFPTAKDAIEYAKDIIGADKVKLIKSKERKRKEQL